MTECAFVPRLYQLPPFPKASSFHAASSHPRQDSRIPEMPEAPTSLTAGAQVLRIVPPSPSAAATGLLHAPPSSSSYGYSYFSGQGPAPTVRQRRVGTGPAWIPRGTILNLPSVFRNCLSFVMVMTKGETEEGAWELTDISRATPSQEWDMSAAPKELISHRVTLKSEGPTEPL